jgi:hypothetical protein
MQSWDIFISYASRDKQRAQQLFELLKPELTVFFDAVSIDPGDRFGERIGEALHGTRITAVLVSINSGKAWYQEAECAHAIELARDAESGKRIVPVYLDGFPQATEWNLFGLKILQGLDASGPGGLEEVVARLLAVARNQAPEAISATRTDHILNSIPMGPMVDGSYVDDSLIDAYAERFSAARADLLVDQANAFRKQADPKATTIRKSDIPRVEQVEPIRYWQSVFREARLHGPRMLAALLLVVNDETFPAEAQAGRRKLLDLIKAGATNQH